MCSIHHEKKAIFIHINKTGGSYIAGTLEKYYGFKTYYLKRPDHDIFCLNKKKNMNQKYYENRVHGVLMYYKTSPYLNKQMGMNTEKWETYFKFTFIRNPYDRIVSGWNHLGKKVPFSKYLLMKNKVTDMEYIHVFMPQIRHIINMKNKISMDFIGHFENLENDFLKVLYHIGITLPSHDSNVRVNVKPHKKYIEYYDQMTLNIVNEIIKDDLNAFHYKRYENIEDFRNQN